MKQPCLLLVLYAQCIESQRRTSCQNYCSRNDLKTSNFNGGIPKTTSSWQASRVSRLLMFNDRPASLLAHTTSTSPFAHCHTHGPTLQISFLRVMRRSFKRTGIVRFWLLQWGMIYLRCWSWSHPSPSAYNQGPSPRRSWNLHHLHQPNNSLPAGYSKEWRGRCGFVREKSVNVIRLEKMAHFAQRYNLRYELK